MQKFALAVVASTLIVGVSPVEGWAQERGAAALDPDRVQAIDDIFRDMASESLPGCAVGVVSEGELVFGRGYGMANLEHGIPLSTGSVFRMGSVAKQFTAATVALLAMDSVIDLDADIRYYLPELPEFEDPVTVRHLIHHTSGYRDYLTLMDLAGQRPEDYYDDPELYLLLTRQEALNFRPGDAWNYSNSGYFLLGQLVLRVTGRGLGEVARERIFERLGMDVTHYHDHWRRIVPDRATGYSPAFWFAPEEEGPTPRDEVWPGYVENAWAGGREAFAGRDWVVDVTTLPMIGDGGVFSSVDDMVPWVWNLIEPSEAIGGDSWRQLMLTRAVLNDGDTLDYAFGLEHGNQRGLRTVGHGGSFVGYRAAVQTWPDARTGVVVLCNRSDVRPSPLASRVGAAVLGDLMDPEAPPSGPAAGGGSAPDAPAPVALSPARLEELSGTYYSRELDAEWELAVVEGELRLAIAGIVRGPLRAASPSRMVRNRMILDFTTGGDEAVDGFVVQAGRVEDLRFVRVTEPTRNR